MIVLINFLCIVCIVTVHEYGHFYVARKCGLTPPNFSFGFGWELLSFHHEGTRYSFRAIPFGGFVRLPEKQVHRLPAIKRIAILLGGPLGNLALCLAVAIPAALFVPQSIWSQPVLIRLAEATVGTVVLFFVLVPLTMYLVGKMLMHPISSSHMAVGPLSMLDGKAIPESMNHGLPLWALALFTLYLFSMGVGSFNLMPLSVLDGGRVASILLPKHRGVVRAWDFVTGTILLGVILLVITGDVRNVL